LIVDVYYLNHHEIVFYHVHDLNHQNHFDHVNDYNKKTLKTIVLLQKKNTYRFFRLDERSRLLSRLESLLLRRRRDDLKEYFNIK
jgi:hypothetical protein